MYTNDYLDDWNNDKRYKMIYDIFYIFIIIIILSEVVSALIIDTFAKKR